MSRAQRRKSRPRNRKPSRSTGRRAELEHALAVLVGEASSEFALPVEEWTTALPVIPAGVPSTVLARRPDVSAAQSGMLAAQQRVGVANAAWFPDVSLTATGGYASSELGDIFKWSTRAWRRGRAPSRTPVFDGGRHDAGVKNANSNALLDESVARYREQVLVAFRDVEDGSSALRLLGRARRGAGAGGGLRDALHGAFRRALPQRPGEPARSPRRAAQRIAQSAPGAAGGARRPVRGDRRTGARPRRRLGHGSRERNRDEGSDGPVVGFVLAMLALLLILMV